VFCGYFRSFWCKEAIGLHAEFMVLKVNMWLPCRVADLKFSSMGVSLIGILYVYILRSNVSAV
jgi:hypothetical protein